MVQVTSNALPALFIRCIARGVDGQYSDKDSRMALADVAGAMIGLRWREYIEGHGDFNWFKVDVNVEVDAISVWRFHGRLAPLVSLDAANAVAMPVGFWTHVPYTFEDGRVGNAIEIVDSPCDGEWVAILTLPYHHPDDFPAALCAARCYAVLRAKELV